MHFNLFNAFGGMKKEKMGLMTLNFVPVGLSAVRIMATSNMWCNFVGKCGDVAVRLG